MDIKFWAMYLKCAFERKNIINTFQDTKSIFSGTQLSNLPKKNEWTPKTVMTVSRNNFRHDESWFVVIHVKLHDGLREGKMIFKTH
jgi:hypothetical protein